MKSVRHDFDPAYEGCTRCAALPEDAHEPCDPPAKWTTETPGG